MKNQTYAKISGVGGYVPKRVVTNNDLTQYMETSDEWIRERTGIEQRHFAAADEATSDLAYRASLEALENSKIQLSEIDLIIAATLSPDHEFPGLGPFLQAKLRAAPVPTLDIRQQCTGFLYGLHLAKSLIESGAHKNILLVGAEVHSKGLNLTTAGRDVSVLFGDGAAAVVVSACDTKHLLRFDCYADGNFAKELWIEAPGNALGEKRLTLEMLEQGKHYPQMNGKNVFMHAVRKMSECLQKTLNAENFTTKDVDLFLFHQANLRINEKVAQMLDLPREKVFNTIQKYGNTTAATIGLSMRDAMQTGVLKPGMLVASAAFGSGFTWASGVWRQ